MSSLNSLTGFASNQYQLPEGQLSITMRSLNSRFLEIVMTIDDPLKPLELKLTKLFKQVAQRGKADITINFIANAASNFTLNQVCLSNLNQTLEQLHQAIPQGTINLMEVLQYPGVLDGHTISLTPQLEEQVIACFASSLVQFEQSRQSEGAHLADVLKQKLGMIDQQMAAIQAKLKDLVKLERERLLNKIEALQLKGLDANRLEQEVSIMAQKSDIAEEYDRLRAHTHAMRQIIEQPAEVNGKRLDFISQEMLRESNTMASKASSLELSNIAVELKVLCEQIREQVQNIE